MEKQNVALETNWDMPLYMYSILMITEQFVQLTKSKLTSFVWEKLFHYTLTEHTLYLRILNYFTDIRGKKNSFTYKTTIVPKE